MPSIAVILTFSLAVVTTVSACIHTYTYNDELHVHRHLLESTGFTYEDGGDNWATLNTAWTTCSSGTKQTPVVINTGSVASPPVVSSGLLGSVTSTDWKTDFTTLGKVYGLRVINTGHAMQVEWEGFTKNPTATVQVFGSNLNDLFTSQTGALLPTDTPRPVSFTPTQFHCHVNSEHLVDGRMFAAECHIVATISNAQLASCTPSPCIVVIGMPYVLGDADNQVLKRFIDAVPATAGAVNSLPIVEFALNSLLGGSDQPAYYTYEGSLTTPPCSEGLRWHLLTQPQQISQAQWEKLQSVAATDVTKIPFNARRPQPLNGRKVYKVV